MNYVIIRTDSGRSIEIIGKANTKKNAETIMEIDFKHWFWQKVNESEYASFEDALVEYTDEDECELEENYAWLNGCLDTDFDWKIINTTVETLDNQLSLREIVLATSDNSSYVQGNVIIDVNDIIGYGLEEFLDLFAIVFMAK